PEAGAVGDAGTFGRGAAAATVRGYPVEPFPQVGPRLAVALLPLALSHWALVPLEAQPLQVADDLLLASWEVPLGIRVVDPQQHPVAEAAVRDGAERVPDVKRTGRARGETDLLHLRPSLESEPVEPALLSWFAEHGRDLPWRRTRDPYVILVSEVMLQQTQ